MAALANIIKAPGSTIAGLAVGTGVGVGMQQIPATGNSAVDIVLTVLQVLGTIIPIIIGALRGPKP